jgi:uncharacterized protein (DUF697 family)/GTP-binding protein EngB required for normal cell division
MSDDAKEENLDFTGKFLEGYNKAKSETTKVNILVLGATGSGKSSLVNCVFKKKIFDVGAGRPVSRGIDFYENEYMRIYDSEGYESGKYNQDRFTNLISDFIKNNSESVNKDIHLVWYCVSAPSARFTDGDAELINKLIKEYEKTLAVVLTKMDQATQSQYDELSKAVKESCKDVPIFLSSTEKIEISPDKGLDALQTWSINQLDESCRKSFISVSNRNIEMKKNLGDKIVLEHVAGNFAVGFSPIPFSDAPVLILSQMALLGRLFYLWDMQSLKEVLMSSTILELTVSQIGKTVTGSLLKIIPGIGTIAGGIISGSIAAALTYALGTAVNQLCYTIVKDELAGKNVTIKDYLNINFFNNIGSLFKEYKNKKSE